MLLPPSDAEEVDSLQTGSPDSLQEASLVPHERQLRPTVPVALEPELGPGLGLEPELVPGPGHAQPELEPLVQLEHVQPVPVPEPVLGLVPGLVLGPELVPGPEPVLELELELVPGHVQLGPELVPVRRLRHVAVVVVERQRLPLPVVEVADYSSAWDFGEPE